MPLCQLILYCWFFPTTSIANFLTLWLSRYSVETDLRGSCNPMAAIGYVLYVWIRKGKKIYIYIYMSKEVNSNNPALVIWWKCKCFLHRLRSTPRNRFSRRPLGCFTASWLLEVPLGLMAALVNPLSQVPNVRRIPSSFTQLLLQRSTRLRLTENSIFQFLV